MMKIYYLNMEVLCKFQFWFSFPGSYDCVDFRLNGQQYGNTEYVS